MIRIQFVSRISFRPHRLAWPRTLPFQGSNTGSNPVGDTTFFFFSLAAGSLFQPSRFVELASTAGYTDWQWLGDCF